jgi:hypothetical protein
MKTFDLDRGFETRGEIDSVQAALTEAQLMLEAVKNGIDPAGAEAHQQYCAMYRQPHTLGAAILVTMMRENSPPISSAPRPRDLRKSPQ